MHRQHRPKVSKIPPDGGYGWVIVLAMALNSFIYVPLMHCFGLIFKDTFAEMDISMTEGSLIINLHAAFGQLTGLINGVLLKSFGYRKMALLAAAFYFSGVTTTSFAYNFQTFVITYGLIASLGIGMSKGSYSLALNSYFKKRRSKAVSLTSTITGLGSVFMPQVTNLLMKYYTPEGVILIFGGICAHSFVFASLLQPVKRHMKAEEEPLADDNQIEEEDDNLNNGELEVVENCHNSQVLDHQKHKKKTFWTHVCKTFDLYLLTDPIFVNILIGLSFVMFAELNFAVLVPFILNDFGLSTDQIATFMSTAGFADITFRFLAPYIGDFLKKPPKIIYILTLIVLIIMRFILLLSSDFYILLLTALGLGMAKGIRRAYTGLIIPSHVSLERLPSASGMEMMANGFCILAGGSILGIVRDVTGSYTSCILIMNSVLFVTATMWTVEQIILRKKNKQIQTEQL